LREAPAGKIKAWSGGTASFEGTPTDDVLVELGDGILHVYLAPDTGEVLGTRRSEQGEEGLVEVITQFAGHQTVSGLRLPFEETQKAKGEVKASVKLASIQVNAGYSEEIFTRPAAPQK